MSEETVYTIPADSMPRHLHMVKDGKNLAVLKHDGSVELGEGLDPMQVLTAVMQVLKDMHNESVHRQINFDRRVPGARHRLYHYYADASNYECAEFYWRNGNLHITYKTAGTGAPIVPLSCLRVGREEF